jgi:hypothetical protein
MEVIFLLVYDLFSLLHIHQSPQMCDEWIKISSKLHVGSLKVSSIYFNEFDEEHYYCLNKLLYQLAQFHLGKAVRSGK